MTQSRYLAGLDAEQRAKLEQKLLARQTGRCFICDDQIDLMLHKGQLDIDHIDPLIEDGLDDENNFALTHAPGLPLEFRDRRGSSAHNLKVVGSNPTPATKLRRQVKDLAAFPFRAYVWNRRLEALWKQENA
jgi:hypothetical protein